MKGAEKQENVLFYIISTRKKVGFGKPKIIFPCR